MTVNTKKKIHIIKMTFLIILAFVLMFYISLENYLITHIFFEMSAVVVSITIFSIGWNTREYTKNNFMTILSVGYLEVGILTLFHTITYKGMGVLPGYGTNLPTQFWIASRYIESITMLMASFSLGNKKHMNSNTLLLGYLILNFVLCIGIFSGFFPACFVEGHGLTLFKMISEYLICFILLITGSVLCRYRNEFSKEILRMLLWSIGFTILSELLFTLYSDPYGLTNILGHFAMVVSVVLIYISLVQGNLARPYQTLFKNITDYAEELEQKNKELEMKDKALASSLTAIVFTDLSGRLTYVNESYLNLLGYEEGEVVGHLITEFIHTSAQEELVMERPDDNGRYYGEILFKKKNGAIINTLLASNLICSRQGDPICGMVSFLDITQIKRIEEELINAKNEADAANRAKSYFLANMSHEIRTPMNGVLGFLQLLESTSMSKQQQKYIHYIKNSADGLLAIINDILDVSKIEAGKMVLENITFDLHHIIENSINTFHAAAGEKGLELSTIISPNVPQYVVGDPARLRQVIRNLVGNAVKFTKKGYVQLGIELIEKKERDSIIRFTVEDTGIGINQGKLRLLFQPLTQADASSSRKYGGSGLGLTICKSIVEMMGGDIAIESIEGEGTKCIFTVMLKEDPNKQSVQPEDALKYILQNKVQEFMEYKCKVLLAEDNEINIYYFVELLKIYAVDCDIAINGEEAVKACLREDYDMVFMDCQMPVLDGYEATRKIREAQGNGKHTVIIAMTANAMQGDAAKCLAAGMDDYLSKPININCLKSILEKYKKY